jgi:hypothetical protein
VMVQGRVNPSSQVVECYFLNMRGNVRGATTHVGERLQVGDEQRLRALALEDDASAERAGVVPKVERACGAVPGQYGVAGRWGTGWRGNGESGRERHGRSLITWSEGSPRYRASDDSQKQHGVARYGATPEISVGESTR